MGTLAAFVYLWTATTPDAQHDQAIAGRTGR